MHRLSRALLAAPLLLGTGCYEYVRTSAPASLVGQRVQVVLTDAGTAALGRQLGPNVEALDGGYVGDSSGTYLLSVVLTRTHNGEEVDWKGERVAVPQQFVSSFLERRFSRSRTAFAGGLATVGIVGATIALRGTGGASGGGNTQKPVGSQ